MSAEFPSKGGWSGRRFVVGLVDDLLISVAGDIPRPVRLHKINCSPLCRPSRLLLLFARPKFGTREAALDDLTSSAGAGV